MTTNYPDIFDVIGFQLIELQKIWTEAAPNSPVHDILTAAIDLAKEAGDNERSRVELFKLGRQLYRIEHSKLPERSVSLTLTKRLFANLYSSFGLSAEAEYLTRGEPEETVDSSCRLAAYIGAQNNPAKDTVVLRILHGALVRTLEEAPCSIARLAEIARSYATLTARAHQADHGRARLSLMPLAGSAAKPLCLQNGPTSLNGDNMNTTTCRNDELGAVSLRGITFGSYGFQPAIPASDLRAMFCAPLAEMHIEMDNLPQAENQILQLMDYADRLGPPLATKLDLSGQMFDAFKLSLQMVQIYSSRKKMRPALRLLHTAAELAEYAVKPSQPDAKILGEMQCGWAEALAKLIQSLQFGVRQEPACTDQTLETLTDFTLQMQREWERFPEKCFPYTCAAAGYVMQAAVCLSTGQSRWAQDLLNRFIAVCDLAPGRAGNKQLLTEVLRIAGDLAASLQEEAQASGDRYLAFCASNSLAAINAHLRRENPAGRLDDLLKEARVLLR